MDLEKLVEKAIKSALFTSPTLGEDLKIFLDEKSCCIKSLAKKFVEENVRHIYWVGSGNSWTNLWSGKYIMDHFTDLTSDVYVSYDFITRDPKRLDKDSWVFLASYTGSTEDTVKAMRYANGKGAKTITITSKIDSAMGKEGKEVIIYKSNALYVLPLAFAYLFSLEVAKLKGEKNVQEVIDNIYNLPELLEEQFTNEKLNAKKLAEQFKDKNLIYVLGTGPSYGIAYKFGLTVFMENMRINGSFMDTTEFRHGPVEVFYKNKPAFVVLVGTDNTRDISLRVVKLIKEQNSPIIVYDMKDYPNVHPLLSPFMFMIPLQWFSVYSALMRGIIDLDDRVVMGRGILSEGKDITWP